MTSSASNQPVLNPFKHHKLSLSSEPYHISPSTRGISGREGRDRYLCDNSVYYFNRIYWKWQQANLKNRDFGDSGRVILAVMFACCDVVTVGQAAIVFLTKKNRLLLA